MQDKKVPCLYKKRKGFASCSQSSLLWQEADSNTQPVIIPYSDIKTQLANKPKDNQKFLLKIQTTNAAFTFSFSTLIHRDTLSNELKNSLSPAAAPSLTDIKARQALLASHPDWKQLHKELVIGNVLSEEDFWMTRKDLLIQQNWTNSQKKGLSSTLLADIIPTDGEENAIKFQINADIIHSIFTQYPGVHNAYLAYVPDKLTETEFWTKYFSSKYFHKNMSVMKSAQKDDIFKDFMTETENDMLPLRLNLVYEAQNKLLDLTSTLQDHIETGNRPDITMKAGACTKSLPLIRKFNRHSQLILKESMKTTVSISAPQTKKQKVSHNADTYSADTTHNFADIFQRETELTDLEVAKAANVVPLAIKDKSLFNTQSLEDQVMMPLKTNADYHLNLSEVSFDSLKSKSLIFKLSEQVQKAKKQNVPIPESIVTDCKQIHLSTNELLRHFWATLFSSTPDKSRLERIALKLKEFLGNIHKLETSVSSVNVSYCKNLLGTLKTSITNALSRMNEM
ncbi:hypothetical protein BC833DRAFT_609412 [Globomyces pollinis-pini]|nr:hypothetical protein BC833DRAFT_609412 [Globomyces pollinis-pini]